MLLIVYAISPFGDMIKRLFHTRKDPHSTEDLSYAGVKAISFVNQNHQYQVSYNIKFKSTRYFPNAQYASFPP